MPSHSIRECLGLAAQLTAGYAVGDITSAAAVRQCGSASHCKRTTAVACAAYANLKDKALVNDAKLTAMGMLATENKRFWRGLTNHTERCAQLCDSLGTASFGVLIFEAGDCSAVPPSRRAGTARLRRQDCAQAACASEHGRDRTLPLRGGFGERRLFMAHSGAECGANECVLRSAEPVRWQVAGPAQFAVRRSGAANPKRRGYWSLHLRRSYLYDIPGYSRVSSIDR